MSIIVKYNSKERNVNFNIQDFYDFGTTYDISCLLDNVKMNVEYPKAEIIIIRSNRNNKGNTLSKYNDGLISELQSLLNFIDVEFLPPDGLDILNKIGRKMSKITDEIDENITIYPKIINLQNSTVYKRDVKEPITIGVCFKSKAKIVFSWFVKNIKISEDFEVELDIGDIFIFDKISSGSKTLKHGLCVKFKFCV